MSASKSKTKETTAQTQTSSGTATTTPNTPDWLAQPWQQQVANIGALQSSGQPLMAGAQPLQQQAFDGAASLTPVKNSSTGAQTVPVAGSSPSTGNGFDLAQSLGLGVAGAGANTATGATNFGSASADNRNLTDVDLAGYFNPFEQRVIDTTLSGYDQNSERQLAAQRGQQAMNGGLRNSNNAIAQALLQGEQGQGRGEIDANLRYAGYNTATGLAQTDLARETQNNQYNAGLMQQRDLARAAQEAQLGMFNAGQQDSDLQRQLAAAGLISGNASAQGADTRANIGLQADLGGQQRDIANSQTPAANLALIQQLLAGVPLDAFVGQTENRNQTGSGTGSGTRTSSGSGFDLASLWGASNGGGR